MDPLAVQAEAATRGNDERAVGVSACIAKKIKKARSVGGLSGLWLTLRGGLWFVLNVIQKISAEASSPQEQERA